MTHSMSVVLCGSECAQFDEDIECLCYENQKGLCSTCLQGGI